jgi:glucose-6-phosphate 1-dehydrogenase
VTVILAQPEAGLNRAATVDLPRFGTPAAIVIFGASGDLTHRKLVPALYNLSVQSLLDERSHIIGVARREKSDESFRAELEAGVREFARVEFDPSQWSKLAGRIHYVCGDFNNPESFARLSAALQEQRTGPSGVRNRLFYLATPPDAFAPIVAGLKAENLDRQSAEDGFARLIVEKPFGHDLASARALNDQIARAFGEDQIFRIDHYLGKETVQNVLVFRLGNGIFEPLWNRRYVDHVQITAAESIGLEGRAGYFDQAGIARDMVQSHLLQLLTVVAMEPPVAFEARAVHDEKVKVLRSIRTPDAETLRRQSVRAQYGQGSIAGTPVTGYRSETGIPSGSDTETFVALRLELDNWRWAGVPFYLRTGKRLPKRATEVAIVFRRPPLSLFEKSGVAALESNVLAIRIQPDEGISLKFASKVPGHDFHVDPVQMDFLYSRAFGIEPPEAYERLLLDAIAGDSTLFARIDEVELGWQLVDALRHSWLDGSPAELCFYEAGTWGPDAAHELLAREGRKWRRL